MQLNHNDLLAIKKLVVAVEDQSDDVVIARMESLIADHLRGLGVMTLEDGLPTFDYCFVEYVMQIRTRSNDPFFADPPVITIHQDGSIERV